MFGENPQAEQWRSVFLLYHARHETISYLVNHAGKPLSVQAFNEAYLASEATIAEKSGYVALKVAVSGLMRLENC